MASQRLGLRLLGLGLLLTLLALAGELAFLLLYSDFARRMFDSLVPSWTSSWFQNACGYVRGANLWCAWKVGRPVFFLLPNIKVNLFIHSFL